MAYVKRGLPDDPVDLRDPLAFQGGAKLFLRERAAATADDVDVTEKILGVVAEEEGVTPESLVVDVKDLESSYDGRWLIFAARVVAEPVDANLDDTTWNIWLYDLETREASYLVPSRTRRNEGVEAGGGHDIAPHFLPDDRVVFSSTRQVASQARLLNEGRSQIFSALDEDGDDPAAVLHIYDPLQRDSEFKQISFNLSHDLDPVVLSNGEIVFSRWNNTATDHISLYRIEPSGAGLSVLYGYHSQSAGTDGAPIEYTQPRELDDGRLASLARRFASDTFGGDIVLVDTEGYVELDRSVAGNEGGQGHEPLTDREVRTDGLLSRGGQFGSVYPLSDGTGRLLLTWSECRVIDQEVVLEEQEAAEAGDLLPCTLEPDNTRAAPYLYGAWVYDPVADTQKPVVLAEEGFQISEIIAVEARDYPSLLSLPQDYDGNLALENQGKLRIDSVYDIDGRDASPLGIARHAEPGTNPYRDRPARFLRVVLPVPLPDDEVLEIPRYAFGVNRGFGFREIAGYAPIEPDGSVTVTVPADRAFTIEVLDAEAKRIGPRHDYWLQVARGEVLRCSGCHERGSTIPHGRLDAQPVSANPGARALTGGILGFPGTDANDLFANETGDTMAEVWDFHRPLDNEVVAVRQLATEPAYTDQWSGPDRSPDADILDLAYDPAWTDIPAESPIVVANLDPALPGRIVINYPDHIQPIWQRERDTIIDAAGNAVTSCIGCHSTEGDTRVAAGQLDLSDEPSDVDPDHLRSYRELLSADAEQWLSDAGAPADRLRSCTTLDDQGNTLTTVDTVPIAPVMRAGSAMASAGFFDCFSGGACGPSAAPPLPDNCTEEGGEVITATQNTVNHQGLLSPAERRLIAEWLDIGAQYFNNPFDVRLSE